MATSPENENLDTTPGDPADDNAVVEKGFFIRKGYLLGDLTTEITADKPSTNAKLVKERLRITQECDFEAQLLADVGKTTPSSLGGHIKQYVRNNASDNTELPGAARLMFNPDSLPSSRSAKMIRRPSSESVFPIELVQSKKIVTHLSTKPNIWALKDGKITFTDRGEVLINLNMMVGVSFSDTDTGSGTVSWRFSDTGTNRYVILTPILQLGGSLTTAEETMRIPLGEIVVFPEDILSRKRVPFHASIRFPVKDDSGTYGRVDSASLHIERSTWVATVGGNMDAVGFYKQSLANVPDTANFLEVIEL